MLSLVSSRSTCRRRSVACIITDNENHVLSTGYNGVPRHFVHCTDMPCAGARDEPGNSDNCLAIHAEANALLQCHRLDLAHVMYCSASPCYACAKMIANTRIKQVYYQEKYADQRGLVVLSNVGIEAHHVTETA